jgi:glucuronyl/N-acetylglucosaminyl transferase EXT1
MHPVRVLFRLLFVFVFSGTWPSYRRTLDFPLPARTILVSTSHTPFEYQCSSHVTFPLFHSNYPAIVHDSFGHERSILLSFKGKSYADVQHHRTFFRHLHNQHDIIIEYTDEMFTSDIDRQHEYTDLLRRSLFCLVPSGRRLYSYRFLESLQYGCIPVITTENDQSILLPFSEIIDWSTMIIIYTNRSLSLLPHYLRAIDDQQRMFMQEQCRHIWQMYFSSISRIVLTVLDIVHNRFVVSSS